MLLLSLLLASSAAGLALARPATFFNDRPLLDVNGEYVDAHDGSLVERGGVYFLYGERYGTLAGSIFPTQWAPWPQLAVYTSPDLMTWTDRGDPLAGELANYTNVTKWMPTVLWSEARQQFVMWVCRKGWTVATSDDGVHFQVQTEHTLSRFGFQNNDGTGILFDDDGQGYIAFAATGHDHQVSIERLTPDLLDTTRENVTGFFPDRGVEAPGLFKRAGTYYLTYGACCCACRGGGGVVVFTASNISGPWVRQAYNPDVNCRNAEAEKCTGDPGSPTRGDLVYNAQFWGPASIPLANGTVQVVYLGRRWLSGFGNNIECDDMCGNGGGQGGPASCESPAYLLRTDFSVFHPLTFTANGSVAPFTPLASWTIDIPDALAAAAE